MSQRITGTVKSFDIAKGYGYIDAGTNTDIFVYYQSIIGVPSKNLTIGDRVEFIVNQRPNGPEARKVSRL